MNDVFKDPLHHLCCKQDHSCSWPKIQVSLYFPKFFQSRKLDQTMYEPASLCSVCSLESLLAVESASNSESESSRRASVLCGRTAVAWPDRESRRWWRGGALCPGVGARPGAGQAALMEQLHRDGGPPSLASAPGWKEGGGRAEMPFWHPNPFLLHEYAWAPWWEGQAVLPLVNVVRDDGRCSPGALTWPFLCAHAPWGLFLSLEGPQSYQVRAPPLHLIDLSCPLKALSLRMATVWVRTSTCEI